MQHNQSRRLSSVRPIETEGWEDTGKVEEPWRQVFIEFTERLDEREFDRDLFPENQQWVELPRADLDGNFDGQVLNKVPAVVGLRARVIECQIVDRDDEEVVVMIDIIPNHPNLIKIVSHNRRFFGKLSTTVTRAINLFERGQVPIGAGFHGYLGMKCVEDMFGPRLTTTVWDFKIDGNPEDDFKDPLPRENPKGILRIIKEFRAKARWNKDTRPMNPWWTSDSEAFSPAETIIVTGLHALLLNLWYAMSGMRGVERQLIRQDVRQSQYERGTIKTISGHPLPRPWEGPDLFPKTS